MPPHVYTKWFEKQEQWSQIKCPHCCRFTHADHVEERVLHCPTCRKSICIECEKPAHQGQCNRTSKEDLKAVINALRHEGAAMCPRCSHIAGRMKEGCNRIVCTKPCTQVFCFKCSRDWTLCKGQCKGGSTELLTQKAEAEDSSIAKDVLNELMKTVKKEMKLVDQEKLAKEKSNKIGEDYAVCVSTIDQALLDGSAAVTSDVRRLVDNFITTLHEARGVLVIPREVSDERTFTHEDEDIEEEPAYTDEHEEEIEAPVIRKRAPTGDLLFRRLLKKPRIEIIDDDEEEDPNDLKAGSDGNEDTVTHDDQDDDDGGFDVEDEYRSDDDEEQDDESEEDHVEW